MKKRYKLIRLRKRDYFIVDEEDYPEKMIEEELENDGISVREEGFWLGYNKA